MVKILWTIFIIEYIDADNNHDEDMVDDGNEYKGYLKKDTIDKFQNIE